MYLGISTGETPEYDTHHRRMKEKSECSRLLAIGIICKRVLTTCISDWPCCEQRERACVCACMFVVSVSQTEFFSPR
jgi:hypothetical protein